MADERLVEWVRVKYAQLRRDLNERARRHWAAVEAISLGRGGITAVAKATGISDRTIRNGIRELQGDTPVEEGRQRRGGGGRKRAGAKDRRLVAVLESLVEPATRGDPQSPLKWTSKSTRELARRWREI
jgi:hypothetical protein